MGIAVKCIKWAAGIAMVLLALALVRPTPVAARIPSVLSPITNDIVPGFFAPSNDSGVNSYFNRQPAWYPESGDGTPTPDWTIARVGTRLQMRSAFVKGWGDLLGTAQLQLIVQHTGAKVESLIGDWNTQTVSNPTIERARAYGLSYLTTYKFDNQFIVDNDDIRYGLTVPTVAAPTWYTYQTVLYVRYPNGGVRYFYSRLLYLLAVPSGYTPALSAEARVLFTGQETAVGVPDLVPNIVPDYHLDQSQAVQSALVDNRIRLINPGVVGQTTVSGRIQFAPMVNRAPPLEVVPLPLTVYLATLDQQTVYQSQSVTFRARLPAGLTVANARWFVDEQPYLANPDGTLTIMDAQADASVYAVLDIEKDGAPLANDVVTNRVGLTVLPPRRDYDLTFSVPFLFAATGDPSPLGRTDRLQATVASLPPTAGPLSWRAYVPGTQTPSDLVRVVDGQVTAREATGAVTIVAQFEVAGSVQRAERTLTVVHLPDASAAAGSALTLTAPAGLPPWPPGATVSYSWYLAADAPTIATVASVVTAAGSYRLANVNSASNNQKFQLVIRVAQGDQVHLLTSNVATVAVVPPVGLALQVVPNFSFVLPGMRTPTVGDLSQATTLVDTGLTARQIVVSDNQPQPGTWQLSMSLDDFAAVQDGRVLTNSSQRGRLVLVREGVQETVTAQTGGPPVIVAQSQAAVAQWQVVGTLQLDALARVQAGAYGAQLHWTLAALPPVGAP